jgi:hemerythrin-like domain-containing protein
MNKEVIEILENLDTQDGIRDLAVAYLKKLEKDLDEDGIVFFLNLSRLISEAEMLTTQAELLEINMQKNIQQAEEDAETNAVTTKLMEAVNPPYIG